MADIARALTVSRNALFAMVFDFKAVTDLGLKVDSTQAKEINFKKKK